MSDQSNGQPPTVIENRPGHNASWIFRYLGGTLAAVTLMGAGASMGFVIADKNERIRYLMHRLQADETDNQLTTCRVPNSAGYILEITCLFERRHGNLFVIGNVKVDDGTERKLIQVDRAGPVLWPKDEQPATRPSSPPNAIPQ